MLRSFSHKVRDTLFIDANLVWYGAEWEVGSALRSGTIASLASIPGESSYRSIFDPKRPHELCLPHELYIPFSWSAVAFMCVRGIHFHAFGHQAQLWFGNTCRRIPMLSEQRSHVTAAPVSRISCAVTRGRSGRPAR